MTQDILLSLDEDHDTHMFTGVYMLPPLLTRVSHVIR